MASSDEKRAANNELPELMNGYLQKFRLYETRSTFYMIGRDKNRTCWRVLKIDRRKLSELTILEDSTTFSEKECRDLLKRTREGNMSTGGLRFVTTCYGIIGFIKFLGPYYMLLITKRKKIGTICGHTVYSIAKSNLIPIPNANVLSTMFNSKDENRYKKLLRAVDLTKDFFFSYSYHVMHTLQYNLCDNKEAKLRYETMYVWNEFLTREIRNITKNTLWTVALVHGFFKQVKFSVSEREFMYTLIARRSRHYAGTRYLKRGVNDKGRVANDVETEQIIFRDIQEEYRMQISSVVQTRGSIPLYWSQESSPLNIKPDIILSRRDPKYEATKLHFESMERRYGKPIILLNLIKTKEKHPRESIIHTEFASAIESINSDWAKENRLRFLHLDLNKYFKIKGIDVLAVLGKVAAYSLHLTGVFYCQLTPTLTPGGLVDWSNYRHSDGGAPFLHQRPRENKDSRDLEGKPTLNGDANENCFKPLQFQTGVLRSNCIDCLDRTNVAQYTFGLAALGHQLHALDLVDLPRIDLDTPLADNLMVIFEAMGNTLARQYGGSGAHNKIFSARRGQWNATTESQGLVTSIKRYYSNAYMDDVKQDAINVFLGYYQPRIGKPALWELSSDQHFNVGNQNPYKAAVTIGPIKRSLSAGNLPSKIKSAVPIAVIKQEILSSKPFHKLYGSISNSCITELMLKNSICDNNISCSRFPAISRQLPNDVTHKLLSSQSNKTCHLKHKDSMHLSNFLDEEWISSSDHSSDEETYDSSTLPRSISGPKNGSPSASESESSIEGGEQGSTEMTDYMTRNRDILTNFSNSFVHWINHEDSFAV